MMKKFDLIKLILPMKFMSLGCTMVTLRSETLLFMSTPQQHSTAQRGHLIKDGYTAAMIYHKVDVII